MSLSPELSPLASSESGGGPDPAARLRVLRLAAGGCAVLAGLLVIGALVLPFMRVVLTDQTSRQVMQTDKTWITGRYLSVSGTVQDRGLENWSQWPLTVLSILTAVTAGLLILVPPRRHIAVVSGLLVFTFTWAGLTALTAVSALDDVGGGVDEAIHVAGGWWFLLASAVLTVAGLVLLAWSARDPGQPTVVPAPAAPEREPIDESADVSIASL